MKNRMNLPAPLLAGLEKSTYDRGDSDVTVSQLVNPPRIAALLGKHGDQIEEDAADIIWRVLGSAVHHFIDAAAEAHDWIQEERFYKTVRGMRVGGQIDCYDPDAHALYDFKVTSAWSVLDGPKDEWVKQMNCYAHLMRHEGHTVRSAHIVAILRDWSKSRVGGKYPEAQAMMLEIPLWSDDEASAYIDTRVQGYQQNVQALDLGDKLTKCTDEERWLRLKKGKPPVYTRCEQYCSVAKWCDMAPKGDW